MTNRAIGIIFQRNHMKAIFGVVVAVVLAGAGWFLLRGASPVPEAVPQADEKNTAAPAERRTYTMEEVASHKDVTSCLTAIRGTVYDVTAFIDKHPGGDKNILKLCGIDGTATFEKKHGGQEKPENALKGFEVGTLAD
jgi:cytochrome b involved in lipid metabolism